ncbi:Alpha-1,3-mannosyltransferase [Klebsormidium nitens]|uniref:Alpha-1,3/1,6-mannosyltransferase ALG2 n=1 Tax=Klebsormidium nitens TaxID=105231 RepID=A0A1Y1HLH2_KLENI|nr:Alpha-1,3-mannosyltransferase [Klebsormidium nitens]|eukprot:GAQ78823.1 Alpha-1,3-mannosyltransferase [Klebsormidium nitens]
MQNGVGSSGAKANLKIAIVHPDLGIGGAERLIVDAAVELASRGHSVKVFTAHHDPRRCFEETLDGSFGVHVYGDWLPRHIFYRFHALCAYLRCLYVAWAVVLLWGSFDVVIADQVSAVIPVLRWMRQARILFYCHFPDMLLAKRESWLRRAYRAPIDWIEERTTGSADLLLVNSSFTAAVFNQTFRHLRKKGVKPTVLYPAVDLKQFDIPPPSPKEQEGTLEESIMVADTLEGIGGLHKKSRIFLSINRFERKKNVGLAIRAYAIMRSQLPNAMGGASASSDGASSSTGVREAQDSTVKLVIAGGFDVRLRENVELLEELKALAQESGVGEDVVFVPSFTQTQKNLLLTASICVLYTPEDEHFGIVPLEAMAARRPVIACNSGGPTESVDHQTTGFLCPPTPDAFAAAMADLLQHPQLAEKMGHAARAHVERSFSREVFGSKLEHMVLQLANERGKKKAV